jgi:2-phospho-L-lactate transferase/gluconeogenesis factor (CofD/UPF0052 family)
MSQRLSVALFSGGRGAASIAATLLRASDVDLTLIVNGYDNGKSTGALRRFLPGMLGPSDFRKNLTVHLDPHDRVQSALRDLLSYRFPAGATGRHLDRLLAGPPFAAVPSGIWTAVAADLAELRRRLADRPRGLDLADCALGNLILAGAHLRLGGDFNAAVAACARVFGLPARLLNVTGGENAFLVARKRDGRILADEAAIVAPQDGVGITELFLLAEPPDPGLRAVLTGRSAAEVRAALAPYRAKVTLNPLVADALHHADLIVYGPGTPHSSLLPSYLTPGLADAIAASRATARVFVANLREDHDVRGLGAAGLVDRTLAYLGDPANLRRSVTHVLCHHSVVPAADARTRWVVTDLADPRRPGVHSGTSTVAALTAIAAETSLARLA